MPTLKAAKKTLRQAQQRRTRNKAVMSAMRSAIKKVRGAADHAGGQSALTTAISLIDRTARKGVIHPNTAARYKARLTRHVQTLG